ncbi:hypothetical protein L7F22_052357 [Adiantum nelumboides]|nr:hypothetical protein [Adiantum nelumboides]
MEPPPPAQPIARTVAGTSATDQESSQQELLQQITNQLESLSINLVQGVRAPQSGNDRNRQEGQRQTREYVCYNCGEVGHGMYFCPHPRRYQGNGNHRRTPRQQVTPPRARPPNGQQNAPMAPPIQILRPPPPPPQTPAEIPPLPSGGEDRAVSVISTKMSSSENDRASPLDRDANLSQRVTCPCNQCKFGVRRQRRVMLQHVQDYDSFDPNTIDQAIADFNTLGSSSEHTSINLQPVRQARMRSTHHIGPSALHPMTPSSPTAHTIKVAPLEESDEDLSDMMLESEMNDMVEAIFEATDPTADDMKQEARTMSDHSGSGSRSPSLSDAQSSPTQSARSASSASSSRRSRLSRASGPERGSERGSRGCGCCGDRDDVDTSASERVPSERGGPSGRQTPSERDTASEGGTPLGRQTPSRSRVQEIAEHTPSGTQESTPEGTPLAHRRQLPEGYSYLVDASGAIIMTPEGKEVISAMRCLCRQVFRHTVMQTFAAQCQDLKDYVIDTLYHDFPVPTPGDRFGQEYMLLRMREYLKHRRDDARRATQRSDWLDREEWRQIREERVTAPDRWEQQRRAARARIDAGSSHHLRSGDWDSFDEDFSPYTGRAMGSTLAVSSV